MYEECILCYEGECGPHIPRGKHSLASFGELTHDVREHFRSLGISSTNGEILKYNVIIEAGLISDRAFLLQNVKSEDMSKAQIQAWYSLSSCKMLFPSRAQSFQEWKESELQNSINFFGKMFAGTIQVLSSSWITNLYSI